MFGKKKKEAPKTALLLGGGGARAAYQVGVLKAISEIIPEGGENPFPIICGTSAGSINASAVASYAPNFHMGVRKTLAVWSRFELKHVFVIDTKSLFKRMVLWVWSNLGWGSDTKGPTSLLDNSPLRILLSRYIKFDKIEKAIDNNELHAFCINACSYTSGESTSFYEGHESIQDWQRTHREGRRTDITVEHLLASSAIPMIFPAVKIENEYFGDGTMRQISPLSPALQLGAKKILIIGLRMESGEIDKDKLVAKVPSLGQILGYIFDTLFLNSLHADIERLERINSALESVPKEQTERLKKIRYLIISPSKDIASIADKYHPNLPKSFRFALKLMGMREGNSSRFTSYLMFTKEYCQDLIELGYQDAQDKKQEIKDFLDDK